MKEFTFNLPGFTSTFSMNSPILPGGNLKWQEFLHYKPSTGQYRKLPTKLHVENALKIADMFEKVREKLGNKPLIITSGYRDNAANKAAGGSRFSYHMKALAIDCVPTHISIKEAYRILDPWYPGGLEIYSAPTWIHFDLRGSKARF